MFACASENEPEGGDHARKGATLSTFVRPCKRTHRDGHRRHTRRHEEKRESARARGIILKVVLPTPDRYEQESHAPDQGRPDSDFARNMPDRTKNATAGNEGLRGWQGGSKSIARFERSSQLPKPSRVYRLQSLYGRLSRVRDHSGHAKKRASHQGVCECLRRINEGRAWATTDFLSIERRRDKPGAKVLGALALSYFKTSIAHSTAMDCAGDMKRFEGAASRNAQMLAQQDESPMGARHNFLQVSRLILAISQNESSLPGSSAASRH